jgi:hypothetical protein
MRFLKTAVILVALAAGAAGTSVVALAYPPPHGHHSLSCSPSHVSNNNGSCTLTFGDFDKGDPQPGETVCFTFVIGRGTVTPQCPTTNASGEATATYSAGNAYTCRDANGTGRGGHHVAIRGTEQPSDTDERGQAQTSVFVTCPAPAANSSASAPAKSGKTPTTASHNTSALLGNGSATPASFAVAFGLLGFIVILSMAITGRLRLRRLRSR